jgi:2-polyprenyl-3-methyl-5-hydroxy-6-metoxy-1,4-benzoquinol methylase
VITPSCQAGLGLCHKQQSVYEASGVSFMPASDLSACNAQAFANLSSDLRESRFRKCYELILKEAPGKLLDVGCARGQFSALLIEQGWNAYGVDLEQAQVDLAKQRGVNATVADLSKGLPFDDAQFDCTFAGEIIEHLVDTDFFLSELRRVTRLGGCLIITTPNLASIENRLRLLLGRYPIWVQYRLGGLGHVRAYTPRALKNQLAEHGFVVEQHLGNWVPFVPQRFADDIRYPWLARTGDLFPSLAMDIIFKARRC